MTEKTREALASVGAAIFLTLLKLSVGLWSGSLGLLAEAANSALDTLASLVTLAAVHYAAQPPDETHHYGHGKAENLGAFVQSGLMLATCLWIGWEALRRLLGVGGEVTHTPWSFVVMAISIVVSLWRVYSLRRSAAAHGSQALEADALHFYTDIYTGIAVLAGLAGVWWAERTGVAALARADAVAALIVVAVLLRLTLTLARQAADVLLDRSHELTDDIVAAAHRVAGVERVHSVRARRVGPYSFVDMSIDVARATPFEESHAIATAVEHTVEQLVPRSDVVVHVDPVHTGDEDVMQEIHLLGQRAGLSIHHITLHEIQDTLIAHLHMELDPTLTLRDAHDRVDQFERLLLREVAPLRRVVVHIEPISGTVETGRDVTLRAQRLAQSVAQVVASIPEIREYHQLHVHQVGYQVHLSLHCSLDPTMTVRTAHEVTERLEQKLRETIPALAHVAIHPEPWEGERKRRALRQR